MNNFMKRSEPWNLIKPSGDETGMELGMERNEVKDDGLFLSQAPRMPNDNIILSEVAILTGGCDHDGRPIITFPARYHGTLELKVKSSGMNSLLRYFIGITKSSNRMCGFAFVADFRFSTLDFILLLKSVLNSLQAEMISVVGTCVLYAILPLDKRTRKDVLIHLALRSSKKKINKNIVPPLFQNIAVDDEMELYNYIEKSHLTSELGGYLQYSHQDWVVFRRALEPFFINFETFQAHLPNAYHRLSSVIKTPVGTTCRPTNDELQQVHALLQGEYSDIRRELYLDEMLDQCESLLRQFTCSNSDVENNVFASVAHKPVHMETRKAMEGCHKVLKMARKKMEEGWTEKSVQIMQEIELCDYTRESKKLIGWFKSRCEMELGKSSYVADNLSHAEMLYNHFETGVVLQSKDTLSEAHGLLQQGNLMVRNNQHVANIIPLMKTLKQNAEQFQSILIVQRKTLQAVYYFHQHYNRIWRWYVQCIRFLPPNLPELLNGHRSKCDPALRLQWVEDTRRFLNRHPHLERKELQKMKSILGKIGDSQLRRKGQLLLHRCMGLINALNHDNRTSPSKVTDIMKWCSEIYTKHDDSDQSEVISTTGVINKPRSEVVVTSLGQQKHKQHKQHKQSISKEVARDVSTGEFHGDHGGYREMHGGENGSRYTDRHDTTGYVVSASDTDDPLTRRLGQIGTFRYSKFTNDGYDSLDNAVEPEDGPWGTCGNNSTPDYLQPVQPWYNFPNRSQSISTLHRGVEQRQDNCINLDVPGPTPELVISLGDEVYWEQPTHTTNLKRTVEPSLLDSRVSPVSDASMLHFCTRNPAEFVTNLNGSTDKNKVYHQHVHHPHQTLKDSFNANNNSSNLDAEPGNFHGSLINIHLPQVHVGVSTASDPHVRKHQSMTDLNTHANLFGKGNQQYNGAYQGQPDTTSPLQDVMHKLQNDVHSYVYPVQYSSDNTASTSVDASCTRGLADAQVDYHHVETETLYQDNAQADYYKKLYPSSSSSQLTNIQHGSVSLARNLTAQKRDLPTDQVKMTPTDAARPLSPPAYLESKVTEETMGTEEAIRADTLRQEMMKNVRIDSISGGWHDALLGQRKMVFHYGARNSSPQNIHGRDISRSETSTVIQPAARQHDLMSLPCNSSSVGSFDGQSQSSWQEKHLENLGITSLTAQKLSTSLSSLGLSTAEWQHGLSTTLPRVGQQDAEGDVESLRDDAVLTYSPTSNKKDDRSTLFPPERSIVEQPIATDWQEEHLLNVGLSLGAIATSPRETSEMNWRQQHLRELGLSPPVNQSVLGGVVLREGIAFMEDANSKHEATRKYEQESACSTAIFGEEKSQKWRHSVLKNHEMIDRQETILPASKENWRLHHLTKLGIVTSDIHQSDDRTPEWSGKQQHNWEVSKLWDLGISPRNAFEYLTSPIGRVESVAPAASRLKGALGNVNSYDVKRVHQTAEEAKNKSVRFASTSAADDLVERAIGEQASDDLELTLQQLDVKESRIIQEDLQDMELLLQAHPMTPQINSQQDAHKNGGSKWQVRDLNQQHEQTDHQKQPVNRFDDRIISCEEAIHPKQVLDVSVEQCSKDPDQSVNKRTIMSGMENWMVVNDRKDPGEGPVPSPSGKKETVPLSSQDTKQAGLNKHVTLEGSTAQLQTECDKSPKQFPSFSKRKKELLSDVLKNHLSHEPHISQLASLDGGIADMSPGYYLEDVHSHESADSGMVPHITEQQKLEPRSNTISEESTPSIPKPEQEVQNQSNNCTEVIPSNEIVHTIRTSLPKRDHTPADYIACVLGLNYINDKADLTVRPHYEPAAYVSNPESVPDDYINLNEIANKSLSSNFVKEIPDEGKIGDDGGEVTLNGQISSEDLSVWLPWSEESVAEGPCTPVHEWLKEKGTGDIESSTRPIAGAHGTDAKKVGNKYSEIPVSKIFNVLKDGGYLAAGKLNTASTQKERSAFSGSVPLKHVLSNSKIVGSMSVSEMIKSQETQTVNKPLPAQPSSLHTVQVKNSMPDLEKQGTFTMGSRPVMIKEGTFTVELDEGIREEQNTQRKVISEASILPPLALVLDHMVKKGSTFNRFGKYSSNGQNNHDLTEKT